MKPNNCLQDACVTKNSTQVCGTVSVLYIWLQGQCTLMGTLTMNKATHVQNVELMKPNLA